MKNYFFKIFISLFLLGSIAANANEPLTSSIQTFLVESDEAGEENLVLATEVSPNDLIEYQMTYQNISESDLASLRFVGAIPASTQYVSGSAVRPETQVHKVSIDGGKTWESEPVVREVITSEGKLEKQVVPASEYTHLSWQMASPMSAKSAQNYSYRVRVQ